MDDPLKIDPAPVRPLEKQPPKLHGGPEKRCLLALVGKRVNIWLKPGGCMGSDDYDVLAWLRWVDVFTIGISYKAGGPVIVIWKSALVALQVAEDRTGNAP